MKVLHIINSLTSGGAEKLVTQIVPLLNSKQNIEVELLILTNHDNVLLNNINKKINIIIQPYNTVYEIKNIYSLFKILKRKNYDIIHVHLFPSLYILPTLKLLSLKTIKSKLVFTEHNSHNKRRKMNFIVQKVENYFYNQYDKVISISSGVESSLLNWITINQKKSIIVNNGIDLSEFQKNEIFQLEDLLDIPNSKNIKTLLMVASFTKQKDQLTIIKTLVDLPSNIHLILVGKGSLLDDCKTVVTNYGLDDRVHFLGFRNDIAKITNTVDIVIVSSNWEGFGLVAVEGMAAKKPVIATNVKGLKDVIGNSGLLFEVGDNLTLKSHILNLINNQNEYKEFSQLSDKRSRDFDIQEMIEQYYEIYVEIV